MFRYFLAVQWNVLYERANNASDLLNGTFFLLQFFYVFPHCTMGMGPLSLEMQPGHSVDHPSPQLVPSLTLNLPTTTIVAQPFNIIKWQVKFNLVA